MNQRKSGIILSYISLSLHTLIGFVYIPMLLSFLSKEDFGLYQLIASIVSYLTVMDFGFANTTIRYYSRYVAQNDQKQQENFLALSALLYLGVAVLIVAVGVVIYHYFLPLYSHTLSVQGMALAKTLFWIMLLNVAIVIPGNIFVAIASVYERFVYLKMVNIINIVIQPLLVYLVLSVHNSVVVLVWVQTICNILVVCANAYYCFAKIHVKIKYHFFDSALFKKLISFSFFVFLAALIDQFYWRAGQLVLGAVTGTVAVAIYSVCIQFVMFYGALSVNITNVFLPHLSQLELKEQSAQAFNEIFLKICRLQFFLAFLMFSGFLLYGHEFILLWLGPGFEQAFGWTLCLFVPLLISSSQTLGVYILQAKNKHAFRSVVLFIVSALNIVISIPAARYYGGLGCAAVTALSLLLGSVVVMNVYYSRLGLQMSAYWKNISCIALPLLPLILLVGIINWVFPHQPLWMYVVNIGLFCLAFLGICWRFSFNSYEKDLLLSFLFKLKIFKERRYD